MYVHLLFQGTSTFTLYGRIISNQETVNFRTFSTLKFQGSKVSSLWQTTFKTSDRSSFVPLDRSVSCLVYFRQSERLLSQSAGYIYSLTNCYIISFLDSSSTQLNFKLKSLTRRSKMNRPVGHVFSQFKYSR